MKRFIITFFTCLGALILLAQTPASMLDKCVAAINASGGVTASYNVTTAQGTSSGSIAMQGNKFRIISNEAKCWYDGKTQWPSAGMTARRSGRGRP